MGYWAWTDLEDYEPYVQGQQPYLDQVLQWAHQYGMDVLMDMHGLPGGQNGETNQGILGPIEFPNNSTNMARALNALSNMTSYVTDPRFQGVVKAIELVNEPYIQPTFSYGMSFDVVANYSVLGYQAVRSSEHIIQGNKEVMVVIHDAFQPILNWNYFFSQPQYGQNWTSYGVDTHFYECFGNDMDKTNTQHLDTVCAMTNEVVEAQKQFPVFAGEFTTGVTTFCIDYQTCVNQSLDTFTQPYLSNDEGLFIRQFWEAQTDMFEFGSGWIIWSHKNQYAAPWSWLQSVAQQWIPEDPTQKIFAFNSNASAGCLNTNATISGAAMPTFPRTTVNATIFEMNVTGTDLAESSSSSASNVSSSPSPNSSALPQPSSPTSMTKMNFESGGAEKSDRGYHFATLLATSALILSSMATSNTL